MKNFAYYRPTSPEQAVGLLEARWGKSELLGGGTDLLDLQKQYIAQPDKVISLADLGGWVKGKIALGKDALQIEALATLADIAGHPAVRKHFPALAEAAGDAGTPQLRNMGTLGGNLCQRNRCWYFRDEHVVCLLKGGDKCYALDGENRYHAVFTKGHKCVIVNPSTLAPVLIALGARAEVLGPDGKRTIELSRFFNAPTGPDEREHVLKPNEMVLTVTLPTSPEVKSGTYEVRHKVSYDWPLVQAAAAFQDDDGKAKKVKVVLGHVAPTPHVSAPAARAIEGKEITEETAAAAGEAASQEEGIRPLAQTGYKVKLIAVAVNGALLAAAGKKKYWEV